MNPAFARGVLLSVRGQIHRADSGIAGQFVAAVAAGALIGIAAYASLLTAECTGLGRFASAVVFPVGILLVLLTGANLFTGNCLSLCWCASWKRALVLFGVSWLGNLAGAVLLAMLVQYPALALPQAFAATAQAKTALPWYLATAYGICCNYLVCASVATFAVWHSLARAWLPVFCFIICGFEHSIADMFYLAAAAVAHAAVFPEYLKDAAVLLFWITVGNVIGGGVIGLYGALEALREERND